MEIINQGQEAGATSNSSNSGKTEIIQELWRGLTAINPQYSVLSGMIQSSPKLIIILIGFGIIAFHKLIFQK